MRIEIVFSFLLICFIAMTGCNNETSNKLAEVIPIIVVDDSLYTIYFDMQQDELSVENGEIIKDGLNLSISFVGGCEEHQFGLIAGEGIEKSNPPRAQVFITHNANNDTCTYTENFLIIFDLSPYKDYLQSSGLLESGTILLPLEGLAKPLIYTF